MKRSTNDPDTNLQGPNDKLFALDLLSVSLCQYRCPVGWHLSSGSRCYLVKEFTSSINWYDAKAACEDIDSTLLVIDSQSVNDFVAAELQSSILYWIGLHDIIYEDSFIWVDGISLEDYGYSNWRPGQPDNWGTNGEDCVYFATSGQWADVPCSSGQVFGYVCQTDLDVPIRCDESDGWSSVNDQCYKFISDSRTWQGAVDFCENAYDSQLITIENDYVQDYVNQVTLDNTIWIGLSDVISGDRGSFTWVDGSLPLYTNWGTNQPVTVVYNQNCVEIQQGMAGNWSTQDCVTGSSFICGKPEGSCSPGWKIYKGQCYQYNTYFPASWTDAKHTCDVQGSHLVTINDRAENNYLVSEFESLKIGGIERIWIGISDTVSDGIFRWADSTSGVTYSKWDVDQPVDTEGQSDCGFMDTDLPSGVWKTSNCFLIQAFVCEIQVGQTVIPLQPGYEIGSCDPEWALHGDYCYLFETVISRGWHDAESVCVSSGGHLASILTADEQSFINSRIDNTGIRTYIGLHDTASEGDFEWIDNSPVDFTNWYPGEPNNAGDNGEHCVNAESEHHRVGTWNDVDCANMYGYICKKYKYSQGGVTTAPKPTPIFDPKCGSGFEFNPDTSVCYKFVTDESRTWEDAETECRKSGGHLLSIGDVMEQNYINARLYGVNSPDLWIGANDRTVEGGWEWSDGSPFAFLNWDEGQPDEYQRGEIGEDCTEIRVNNGRWNDQICSRNTGYICENKGILVDHFNVYHDNALDGYDNLHLDDVYPEDCARRCLDETQFVCKSFDYDKNNQACELSNADQSSGGLSTYPGNPFDYYEVTSYPDLVVTTILQPGSRCASGWFSYGSQCYIMISADMSWHDAKDVCRREGGDLVSIADINENYFVISLIQTACEDWHSDDTNTDYDYNYLPAPIQNNRVTFQVKATSDVHIALAEFDYYVMDQYEIVIGGWGNTQSVIRQCTPCDHEVEVETNQILSATEFRGFWINFANGLIQVGKDGEAPFMEWMDPEPMPINYVGYSTGYGHAGEFRFCTGHSQADETWIGLHDPRSASAFEWSDLSPVTFTYWSNGEPNNWQGRQEDCVNMFADMAYIRDCAD
ncbi:macrophage mannose receptor 1-like [Glandiceps talaboti]